jgi:peptidoglycan hydrolase-like protein with peptidoglycan-binding domain
LFKTAFALAGGLGVAVFAFAGGPTPAATDKTVTKKSSAKSPVSAGKSAPASKNGAASKAAPSKKTSSKPASSTASKKTGSRRSAKTAAAVARRSFQQQPTPQRYKEIQQALSDKGYFGGTADGNWGPESVDALKRFQHDQSLTEDGKIGSLSLIALGLGPNHNNDVSLPSAPDKSITP